MKNIILKPWFWLVTIILGIVGYILKLKYKAERYQRELKRKKAKEKLNAAIKEKNTAKNAANKSERNFINKYDDYKRERDKLRKSSK